MKNLILKQKVSLSLSIASLVSLLVVGIIVFLYIHSILIENKKKDILSSTTEQVHESNLIFENNQLFAHILGSETQVKGFLLNRSPSKKTELLNIFLGHTNTMKKYLSISLLDKNGIALVSTDPRLEGQDYSLRDFYKKSLEGEPSVDTAINKTNNQFGYYFAEPILGEQGDLVSILMVNVDQTQINNSIILSEISKDNFLMLVDEEGIILASTEPSRNFKSLGTLSEQEKNKLQNSDKFLGQDIVPLGYDLVQQGIRDYKNPIIVNFFDKDDGDNEMVGLSKLNKLPFYLVTEIRLEALNEQVFGTVFIVILVILLILMVLSLIVYFYTIQRDITKEKELNKTKTEFVSLASHQLRSPLSAINWYTEMLLDGNAGAINDEQKDYLDEITNSNKRMVELVNDLLNVSRLEMGTFIVETKPINVISLIKSVLSESKPSIIEKKLIIEESYDDSITEFLADEKLLRMVFQNLVSNAVKFTPLAGVIKINISKVKKYENYNEKIIKEDSLVFSISDSGIGIPIHQQKSIFSKLFRADNAKESGIEGTGLGLYVVKSIIDQSSGLVWFKSEENEGSTFNIAFPSSGMKLNKIN